MRGPHVTPIRPVEVRDTTDVYPLKVVRSATLILASVASIIHREAHEKETLIVQIDMEYAFSTATGCILISLMGCKVLGNRLPPKM